MNDENIIDLGNVWIINRNRFTKALYDNNIEIAKKYAETLINCFDCMDCVNCINCNHCRKCDGCKDCEYCEQCNACGGCSYCIECIYCNGCENAVKASRLKMQVIPQQNMPMQMQIVLPQV